MTAEHAPAPEAGRAVLPERRLLTPLQDLGHDELRRIADLLKRLPDEPAAAD